MGRDMRNDNIKNQLIIGSIFIVILVVALITYLRYSNRMEDEIEFEDFSSLNTINEIEIDNTSDYESASSEIGKTVEESENELEENKVSNSVTSTTKKETTNNSVSTSTNVKEKEKKEEKQDEEEPKENKQEKEPKFVAPVKGEIMTEFASESLIYSNTLEEWITHNGIDIKADKTSVVTAAAKGTVYAIKNDPRYGLTVIINHDAGYQTIYSNLLTAEFVVEGEKVEEGQTIGTVGNTASFEIGDDYHLHFEILRNNECIDPTTCINF